MRLSHDNKKLNTAQLDLIKSFKYLQSEKKLHEINSLINFYLERKLDDAIEKVESERNYNALVYEQWLKEKSQSNK
ncbi:MAG: hypothetical protein K0Q79_3730 [Flavipsychrobacter sp.]|jgi:hypothetical protein|nr:hypothetical protein [Flavipsychrobacter sp.]